MPRWSRLSMPAAAITVAATFSPAAATDTPTQVTFAFVGDTILGNTPQLPAHPDAYLASTTKTLRTGTDVVFANLEGTLTTSGTSKCPAGSGGTCYAFRTPPSYAGVFARAGVRVLSLANNHSYDYGAQGLRSTRQAIAAADLRYAGLPGQITYLTVRKVRVAFVAFAPYARTNNLLDLPTAAKLIRRAHAHAQVVVVSMHAGAEGAAADHVTGDEEHYAGEDRGNPRRFAHAAIDDGADLVVASGPHVLRGLEFYRHRLIDYSLGNFANFHNFDSSGVLSRSAILRVTVTDRGAYVAARLLSVTLDRSGQAKAGGDSVRFVATLSRQDFGSRAARFHRDGSILAG